MADNFRELIAEQKRTTTALENLIDVTGSNTGNLSDINDSNEDMNSIIMGQREDTRSAEQIEKDRLKMEKVRAAKDAKGKSADEEDKKEEAAKSEKNQTILGAIAENIGLLYNITKTNYQKAIDNKFIKGAALIHFFCFYLNY